MAADRFELIESFVGSTRIFAAALADVFEPRLLDEAGSVRLTAAQMKVLRLIAQAGVRTVGDVAAFLGVSDAAASRTLDRLVRLGLLKRAARAEDRRTSELALTAAGSGVVAKHADARRRHLAKVFSGCTPEELRSAAAVLDRVAAAIVTHSPNPEQVCLQCDVNFKERCLLEGVVRRPCSYRKRAGRQAQSAGIGEDR
jgi:DNA-binding MarR family transcriptional regulator